MKNLRIATAQFENSSGDKKANLSKISRMTGEASYEGADVISFHECSITGYTFANKLNKNQLLEVSEVVPDGQSIQQLIEIAGKHKIVILAGLFEKDSENKIYNTYVCVDENGVIAKFRKIHPFINSHLSPGSEYVIFDIKGWKCGILICYDNNIIENVRATTLLGAEIIIMPHVTMCTPSTRPGAGFVDSELWKNRHEDPTSLRIEFDGLKGRQWLMKWLPARAYDNSIYAIFSNPIGMDDDQLKNGCSMVIDPFGDVIAECRNLDDEFVIAECVHSKIEKAGGYRYRNARKPALYGEILGSVNVSKQRVAWLDK